MLFQITDFKEDLLAFLILDIETVPRPSIDETVDEAVHKKSEILYRTNW